MVFAAEFVFIGLFTVVTLSNDWFGELAGTGQHRKHAAEQSLKLTLFYCVLFKY